MVYGAYKTEGETQHYLDKLGRTGLTFQARDLRNARRVEHLEASHYLHFISRVILTPSFQAADKKLRARSPGIRDDDLPLQEKLIRANVLVPWYNTTDTERLKWFTVAGCAAVFIAWQAPLVPLRNFMRTFWAHHPLSGRKITHLTATFSHQDIYHLGFNMVAFVSFVPAVVATLDRDDVAQHRKPGGELSRIQVTPVWELAAFVVAGGLVSSLASHLWSVRVLLPRAVRALKAQAPVLRSAAAVQSTVEAHSIGSSLGLSGAVYAMLVYVAANNPDLSVGILFLPFISIPIGPAVGVLATFDLLALLRGWKWVSFLSLFASG